MKIFITSNYIYNIMPTPTYTYSGGTNSLAWIFASNPLESSTYPNNIGLINNKPVNQGTTWVEIYANTDCIITFNYGSYNTAELVNNNDAVPALFNFKYARFAYGLNGVSVTSGPGPLLSSTSDYYSSGLPSGPDYNWNYVTDAWTSGTESTQYTNLSIPLTVPKGKFLVLLLTGPQSPPSGAFDYQYTGTLIISGLPSANGYCFGADTLILMGDNTYKFIKDIERGEEIIQDIETNSKAIVSNVYKTTLCTEYVSIPAGLLGNSNDVICTKLHPIWVNNNTRRIYAKDLEGVELISGMGDFYNLQFDDEGSFIADNIKVDSLSPYHKYSPLPEHLFRDSSKYIKYKKVKDENDPSRNKPTLIFNKRAI